MFRAYERPRKKTVGFSKPFRIVAEVNILRDLHHPNIVRYLDRIVLKEEKTIYMIMEYCEFGDLARLIKDKKRKNKDPCCEGLVWKVGSQLVSALNECHEGSKERRILHRDLKPGNVFIDSQYNVKLGDFGLARDLEPGSALANTNAGTPYYMSPEQVRKEWYNEKTDIWGLGCLLYEMASLQPPFDGATHYVLCQQILKGEFPPLGPKYSDELQRVINWCLAPDSSDRCSVSDLAGVPMISLRLKEQKLVIHTKKLEKEALKLKEREKELMVIEANLRVREERLTCAGVAVGSNEPMVLIN